jgi:hypothetical protein
VETGISETREKNRETKVTPALKAMRAMLENFYLEEFVSTCAFTCPRFAVLRPSPTA